MSNHNNGSPMYQSHSLSRSNTFTRMNVSPKCFGTSQYIHKEDHEREYRRWQAKLEEAEQKIAEATVSNSDMAQIKAELNKKIVELEKNQKPLIEQNKRLSDRNRIIQHELKSVEEKLCHAEDNFLTLKDAYSRLSKENSSLKEQRAFPEKVKELDRYRNQVLEYSKCINALRQSGIEKDRRYDLLIQKFKRMKKCAAKRSDDDDRQSSYGSEGSAESSINLDTIIEDIDEALEIGQASYNYDHEVAIKLSALAFGEELFLKEQLEAAKLTIAELQASLTTRNNLSLRSDDDGTVMEKQNQRIEELNESCHSLKVKLANTEEYNDLLEFQLLELREMSKCPAVVESEDKAIETDVFINDDSENDIKAFVKMDTTMIEGVKSELERIRRLACLTPAEREAVKNGLQQIENLQNKLSFAEMELHMAKCEIQRLESTKNAEIADLKNQLNEVDAKVSKKKKELKAELESARKECVKVLKNYQDNQKQIEELKNNIKNLNALVQQKEDINAAGQKQIGELKLLLENTKTSTASELQALKSQYLDQSNALASTKQELIDKVEAYDKVLKEKETMATDITSLKNDSGVKERQLLKEIQELQARVESTKNKSDSEVTELSSQLQKAEAEKLKIVQEKMEIETRLKEMSQLLKTTHDESILKIKEAQRTMEESARQNSKLKDDLERSEKAFAEAKAEIDALKLQIRPIGTQLERRYEEAKFRLQEANKLNHKYEEMLKEASARMTAFENMNQDTLDYMKEITQLRTYNKELEDQFNSQMEIINALKKKFLSMNNNSEVENENWPKLTVQPTSSIDDEQYHSEGSSSIGSYNVARNKA